MTIDSKNSKSLDTKKNEHHTVASFFHLKTEKKPKAKESVDKNSSAAPKRRGGIF